MGLSKDLMVFGDVRVAGAYFRIKTTVMEWETNVVKYVMGAWVSREASKSSKPELPLGDHQEFTLAVPKGAEGGTKADQYQMIKIAVPFFSDAADVLEETKP